MQNPINFRPTDMIVTFQLDFVQAKEIVEDVQRHHLDYSRNFTTPYVVCASVEDFPNWETAQRTRLTRYQLERIATLAAKKGFVAHVLPVGS